MSNGQGLQNIRGIGRQPAPAPSQGAPAGGGSPSFWDSIIEKQADKRFGNIREALTTLSGQLTIMNQNFAAQNNNTQLHYQELQRLNDNIANLNLNLVNLKAGLEGMETAMQRMKKE